MAIKTREELMQSISSLVGDSTDDNALALIEDIQDTLNNLTENSNTNWKEKYENNDKEWRNKYKERFFNGKTEEEFINEDETDVENSKPKRFEDLFK